MKAKKLKMKLQELEKYGTILIFGPDLDHFLEAVNTEVEVLEQIGYKSNYYIIKEKITCTNV